MRRDRQPLAATVSAGRRRGQCAARRDRLVVREMEPSNAARRDWCALTFNLPCASGGERGGHAPRAVIPRRRQDLRTRAAVERRACAVVQGPGGLAGDATPSRAGTVFHSTILWRQGLDR